MRKFLGATMALLLAVTAVSVMSQPAEAGRRGGAIFAAIVGGVALGAILASRHHRKRYVYYSHRPRYYSYRPSYYSYYAPPRRYYRYHYARPYYYRYW